MKQSPKLHNSLLAITLIAPVIFLSACWTQPATNVVPTNTTTANTTAKGVGSISIVDVTEETPADAAEYSVYLIALEDKGLNGDEIGCGDSVVAITQDSKLNNPTENELLNEAFTSLLSATDKTSSDNGYSNFLADSQLKLDSAEIKGDVATVKLSGILSLAGVCDHPRIQAQLESTAKQFDVKSVEIFINNKTLKQALSLQ